MFEGQKVKVKATQEAGTVIATEGQDRYKNPDHGKGTSGYWVHTVLAAVQFAAEKRLRVYELDALEGWS
jgi:hypothetical protein